MIWQILCVVCTAVRSMRRMYTRVAESEVKYPTPTFQNFRRRLLNIKGMNFGYWNQWKSWYTARNLWFNKSFKRNRTISTGIPNLGVSCKKWSNRPSGVGQKNPTPTPRVVRNPTPSENLRILTAPTPHPWCTPHLRLTSNICFDQSQSKYFFITVVLFVKSVWMIQPQLYDPFK